MQNGLIMGIVCMSMVACTTTDSRQLKWGDGTDVRYVTPDVPASGLNGRDGRDGRDGAAGPAGARGPQGETGSPGHAGSAGPQGLAGVAGGEGAQGQRGDRGRDGVAGRDGAPGRDGHAGEPGKDGAPGKNGERGRDGGAGRDGRDGAPGRDGKDGRDGTSLLRTSYEYVPSPYQALRGEHPGQPCPNSPQQDCKSSDGGGGSWWNFGLAILGGVGAFITACTPLLLGLAKLRSEQRNVAAKEVTPATIIGVIFLGGAFFAYLLMVFAVALLAFIIAFMLSSGVLLIAMAYSYKLVGESQMQRELHALKVARLAERGGAAKLNRAGSGDAAPVGED